ncbi:hypothetical protein HXW90_04060 [Pseudomonas sp. Y39-6]|uniref:hypothetical protein n=1 Tax=Pseudomonas sp. Y39-6 TaxID=2749807 RepID=UPI0019104B7B|nr:hypothetical protein [Pseudomonas sp. Y39-6]QPO18736.1 hypothetical protein HXW90_04060 [Pseudomonas sp. Y39-6]URS61853.1 hypothetical protein JN756_04075 [Pseudomonas sp. Y39-6]
MTTHATQGVASRLGYALGVIVRAVWFSQNRTLRWVKRLALIAVAVCFSSSLLTGFLMGVISIVLIMLVLAKSADEGAGSGNTRLWDRNGPQSLWHHEDESRKWQ